MARGIRVCAVDWSNLPISALDQISRRLPVDDYVRLQAVCKPWRAMMNQIPNPRRHHDQLPWLAIPPDNKTSSMCKFYSLDTHKLYHIYLPDLRDVMWVGFCHGWMIVVDRSVTVFLLNPLTGSQIQLSSLPNCFGTTFGRTAIGLALRNIYQTSGLFVSTVTMPNDWKHHYYALHGSSGLFVCGMGDTASRIISPGLPLSDLLCTESRGRLVTSERQLLLVRKESYSNTQRVEMRVYALDEDMLNWVPLADLEGRMLFLGNGFSLSMGSYMFPQWKGDHIYFRADQQSIPGCVALDMAS